MFVFTTSRETPQYPIISRFTDAEVEGQRGEAIEHHISLSARARLTGRLSNLPVGTDQQPRHNAVWLCSSGQGPRARISNKSMLLLHRLAFA